MAATIWSVLDMLELKAAPFVNAVSSLVRIRDQAMMQEKPRTATAVSDTDKTRLEIHLNQLHESLITLECGVADRSVLDLLGLLAGDSLKYSVLVKNLAFIEKAMPTELDTRLVLAVAANTANFYNAVLDNETARKFPSVTYEFDEAGKCIALDRWTAAVFHSMRTLEVALRAIYQCLGLLPLSDKQKSWGTLLNGIKTECERRKPWADEAFFVEVHERLNAIRYAQRNTTMHVESIYTLEEAKLIFDNTKAFIVKIASRMNQDGMPLA